jgi:hypothetical protein
MNDIDEGMERVVEKVRKLLNLAAKNTNEAEAASATAKAQELLAAYNLDMATIEQGGGESGKREEQRMMGGMYLYERELWNAIAQLNFCMYFTTRGKPNPKTRRKISFQHRIIGRTVNTASTKAMGGYIQGVIERLCRERFPVNSQFFSSEAVAFREGMADKIGTRLRERRQEILREEDNKKKAAAAKSGVDTKFALTLTDVKKSEEIGNYNFIHGEGAWERREARKAEREKEWAEERAREAAAEAEADAAYAAWAAANPEEAAAEARKAEAEAKKKREKEDRSWSRRSYRERAPSARERRQNSDYYDDGYRRGAEVSLDQQVDSRSDQKRIGR